ncbi:hypothetical protein HAHE_21680 [Haloferula helveola]|uniref:Calx-beta domain-containing protein n=1 Tax=Haloferula helveola TaxID=490095 RepID=A0ABM7RDS9_9BACT|nr:hypothetical protein HAHE_21680 [Haloferula helveola]
MKTWILPTLIATLATLTARGAMPEPDIVFYGRVLHLGGGAEYVLTSGEIVWTVTPDEASGGEVQTVRGNLAPLKNGTMSYVLRIPQHLAVEGTMPGVLAGLRLPSGTPSLPFRNTTISVEGLPTRLADPSTSTFELSTEDHGDFQRLDLIVEGSLPDSDGDGLPDWWEEENGTDPFLADADADPDGDGATNLEEYAAGSDPTGPDQEPKLPSEVLANLEPGGAAALVVRTIDRDSAPSALTFVPGTLPAGLTITRAGSTDALTTFTQADLDAGDVVIRHSGSAEGEWIVPLTVRDETPSHEPAVADLRIVAGDAEAMWLGWGLAAESQPASLPTVHDASRLTGGATLRTPGGDRDEARIFIASSGADEVAGSPHDDLMVVGNGDRVRGNEGADRLLLANATGTVEMLDFSVEERDVIDLTGCFSPTTPTFLRDHVSRVGDALWVDFSGDGGSTPDLIVDLTGAEFPQDPADLWDLGLLVTGDIVPETTLFLTLSGAASEENLTTATITVRRRGDASAPLDVPLTWSGTATMGLDFLSLASTAHFAAGVKEIDFEIVPLADDIKEPTETIQLELTTAEGWSIAEGHRTLSVPLLDLPSRVWIEVTERIAYSDFGMPAQILVRRSGPMSTSLTAKLGTSGKALANFDYKKLPATVTFSPYQEVIVLDVEPLPIANLRYGAEDVRISVLADSAYLFGETPQGTVLILERPKTLDEWRTAHTIEESTPLGSDGDGDGRDLLGEFAFGGNPNVFDHIEPTRLGKPTDGRIQLTWKRWPSAPEIRYAIRVSTDLKQWSDAPEAEIREVASEILSDGMERVTVSLPVEAGENACFYQIEAQYAD